MAESEEFRSLNAKVLAAQATEVERARWEELKREILSQQEGAAGRRRFQRAPIKAEVRFETREDFILANTEELGAGGLGIELPGEFEIGQEVDLSLTLPGEKAPMALKAQVVWTGEPHWVGFEFVDVPREVQDRIDALVWDDLDRH